MQLYNKMNEELHKLQQDLQSLMDDRDEGLVHQDGGGPSIDHFQYNSSLNASRYQFKR